MWFNKTAVDMNMFIMANEVHNLMEIFNEEDSLEGRMFKYVEALLAVCNIIVSLLVATIVCFYVLLNCIQKLQPTVKRGSSYPPKIITQTKPITIIRSVRGSKDNFWKSEEEDRDIQGQAIVSSSASDLDIIGKRYSNRSPEDDEVTLTAPGLENYSAKLIGTPEWAATYLARGGPGYRWLH